MLIVQNKTNGVVTSSSFAGRKRILCYLYTLYNNAAFFFFEEWK